jgi:ABC-type amino acid transport substrate-binding protein
MLPAIDLRNLLICAAAGLLSMMTSVMAADLELVLGSEGTFPPFSIIGTDGELSGMEIDLSRAMCARMNADCKIVSMDFPALLPALVTGKVDLVISQLTPLPERLRATEFTRPIVFSPTGYVVPRDWNKGFDNAAMAGVKVGVYKGSSHAKFVETKVPDSKPVYYSNNDQMLLDLKAGRIDVVFGDKINWQLLLIDTEDGKDWKLSEDIWDTGKRVGKHWAARKGNTELVALVNDALDSVIEDCTFTEIRMKYLPQMQLLDEESHCL